MTDPEKQQVETLITRRIPRAWRSDIKIEEIGELAQANGKPQGTAFVVISACSKLGRAQAAMSLGSYVTNDPGDWETAWEATDSGKTKWRIQLYDPSAEHQYEKSVFTLAGD